MCDESLYNSSSSSLGTRNKHQNVNWNFKTRRPILYLREQSRSLKLWKWNLQRINHSLQRIHQELSCLQDEWWPSNHELKRCVCETQNHGDRHYLLHIWVLGEYYFRVLEVHEEGGFLCLDQTLQKCRHSHDQRHLLSVQSLLVHVCGNNGQILNSHWGTSWPFL